MKTFKRILAMCFVASTLVFASCGEKEKDNYEPFDLTNSSWEAHSEGDIDIENSGIHMYTTTYMSMDFTSETEGEIFAVIACNVPLLPELSDTSTTTESFTYTFDGRNLVFKGEADEEDLGFDGMTFNPADSTFILTVPDEDLGGGLNFRDVIGSDKIIFHKVR